ncbi:6-carboxytetrahydropterin synthase, partial [Endobacter medicaginis]
PHGHNETVRVWLRPTAPARLDGAANMVEPFARAKARWHRFVDTRLDHGLQLSSCDPLLGWFSAHEPHRAARIVVTPGDPTTELLALCLSAKLGAFLAGDGGRLAVAAIEIEETPTNTVRFAGDPLEMLPAGVVGWWRRADMSVNDLALRDTECAA